VVVSGGLVVVFGGGEAGVDGVDGLVGGEALEPPSFGLALQGVDDPGR
jgi:hypothetical protein